MVVILFSFYYPFASTAQCLENFSSTGSESIKGVVNDGDSYYRNLVVQDIALSIQQPFEDVKIQFDYKVRFAIDQCNPYQAEFIVYPLWLNCYPLFYRGFDISGAFKPEKADLVFNLFIHQGILADSLVFFGVPLEQDSSLYSVLQLPKGRYDKNVSAGFSRAVFYYTRKSYDQFRDKLLAIDRYYAASELADSALKWTGNGFLKESDSLPEMILRQFELDGLVRMVDPRNTAVFIREGVPEPAGLNGNYNLLRTLDRRYITLIEISASKSSHCNTKPAVKAMITLYLDHLDHYNDMAYHVDFRDMPFLEEISSPVLSNAVILSVTEDLQQWCGVHKDLISIVARNAILELSRRGIFFNRSGNQLRALSYFISAYKLALTSRTGCESDSLVPWICRIKKDIISSYLEISRRAFQADNPGMCISYFRDASGLLVNDRFKDCSDHSVSSFGQWLYASFEQKSRDLINAKQYAKSMTYLDEIQSQCSSFSDIPCPEDLQALVKQVNNGMYLEYLLKAQELMQQDKRKEAQGMLQNAVNLRLRSGYSIPVNVTESRLDGAFRQERYNTFISEGVKYLDWKEFDKALYFFNQAFMLENTVLPHPDLKLVDYRLDAAREVIMGMVSEAKDRAISYDFEGYNAVLHEISLMLADYAFGQDDPLVRSYDDLERDASLSLCDKIREEFDARVEKILAAKEGGDYIQALKLAEEAIKYSSDHQNCGIDDSRAWYEKVLLEPLAEFLAKEKKLEQYTGVSSEQYMAVYQEVSSYYYANKLLNQGIILESLYQKVLESEDPVFLAGFLQTYIRQRNLEAGLLVLKKLKSLDVDPAILADQQKELARQFAERDVILQSKTEPWKILESYTGQDKWFADFRWSYKTTWISKTNGNIHSWPLLWKG